MRVISFAALLLCPSLACADARDGSPRAQATEGRFDSATAAQQASATPQPPRGLWSVPRPPTAPPRPAPSSRRRSSGVPKQRAFRSLASYLTHLRHAPLNLPLRARVLREGNVVRPCRLRPLKLPSGRSRPVCASLTRHAPHSRRRLPPVRHIQVE